MGKYVKVTSFPRFKLCYILTMEYYSTVRRNELSSHENTWSKLKCILLSERCQSKKATYRVTLIIQYSGKGKTIETVKISGFQRLRGGGMKR